MRKLAIAAAVATVAMITGANAQEVYVADDYAPEGVIVDDGYVAAAATDDDDADDAAIETDQGARVYGWSYGRPLNCGTYMFWDGDNCVDARLAVPAGE